MTLPGAVVATKAAAQAAPAGTRSRRSSASVPSASVVRAVTVSTAAVSSQGHQRSEIGQGRLPDAVDLQQLVDGGEAAIAVTPVEDGLGRHRSYAR